MAAGRWPAAADRDLEHLPGIARRNIEVSAPGPGMLEGSFVAGAEDPDHAALLRRKLLGQGGMAVVGKPPIQPSAQRTVFIRR